MIPSFLKGKMTHPSASSSAFTSDDEVLSQEEDFSTTNKRKLVDMLQNSSSSAVSKLITKNKERKEKEEQTKKKQKFIKESNIMKEIEERIQRIATVSHSSDENNHHDNHEEDEWEEFTQPQEDEDGDMEEFSSSLQEHERMQDDDEKEDDSLHITIKNEEHSKKTKKVIHRKSKGEHRLLSIMNLTHMILYFNFYYLLNEYISWECEEVKGVILSLLESLKSFTSTTTTTTTSTTSTTNTPNTNNNTTSPFSTIESCVEWVYETFTFHKFKKHSFYKLLVDEKDQISTHLKNLEIHNICELYIAVMLVLIYSGYTVRFVASLELSPLLFMETKKKKKKKKKHFEHDIWLEVNDPKEKQHETRLHYTTIELGQKEPIIENTTLNIEAVEKLYKKMSKTLCEYPIVVVSFDYLGKIQDKRFNDDPNNGNDHSEKSNDDSSRDHVNDDFHSEMSIKSESGGDVSGGDGSDDRSDDLFHYVIRDVTPKHFLCKPPSTLIGKENYQYVEHAMKELLDEINEKNYSKYDDSTTLRIQRMKNAATSPPSSMTTRLKSKVNHDFIIENVMQQQEDVILLSHHSHPPSPPSPPSPHPPHPPLHLASSIALSNSTTSTSSSSSSSTITSSGGATRDSNHHLDHYKDTKTFMNSFSKILTNPFIEKDSLLIQSILTQMELEVPSSIQDFQTHPIYVIDKFIPKYEGMYPKDVEPVCVVKNHNVYLRSSLKPLHTKDRWLRDEMKKVKDHEKPYKIVKSAKFSKHSEYTELFGEWQTEPYSVPMVTLNDPIPKSEKGTYELWNSNFLPQGCSHISTANTPLKGLTIVARKLGIDYARAMVGFEFRQKRSIPKYDGIIVHSENEQVLREAYVAYEKKRLEKMKKKKQDRIMNNWCKLVRGLLAREYVKDKYLNKKEEVFLRDVIEVMDDGEDGVGVASSSSSSTSGSGLVASSSSSTSGHNGGSNGNGTEDHHHEHKKEETKTSSPPKVQRMLASGKIVEFEQL
ncbi:hypothetical protein FDP41_005811 [Naegleria fowleri]|uniref:Rad4 beta-hairpin domain-containing protein n=1 Tax=Naegleria fowleri TaxID=5763 RepID=A0A6A5BLL6_NAEFO|nr:uncharacterized protein FDP41_005811 [Naegleria fowleri]KAF0975058.1 hypothetical protein FDP41_005811 [Naegleria fowleri]